MPYHTTLSSSLLFSVCFLLSHSLRRFICFGRTTKAAAEQRGGFFFPPLFSLTLSVEHLCRRSISTTTVSCRDLASSFSSGSSSWNREGEEDHRYLLRGPLGRHQEGKRMVEGEGILEASERKRRGNTLGYSREEEERGGPSPLPDPCREGAATAAGTVPGSREGKSSRTVVQTSH
ncbi:uncharacterized protein ACB058_002319 [Synchiropus picturatus]